MKVDETWGQIKKEVEVAVKCFDSDRRMYIIYNTEHKKLRTYWYKKQDGRDAAVLKRLFDEGVLKSNDYVIYNSYIDDNICSAKEFIQKHIDKTYDQFCEENMQKIYSTVKEAIEILSPT